MWTELHRFPVVNPNDWIYTPVSEATLFRISYLSANLGWGRLLIGQASPSLPRELSNVRRFYVGLSELYTAPIPFAWGGSHVIACKPYQLRDSAIVVVIDAWSGYDGPLAPPDLTLPSFDL
jgi:hypothetical protein